MKVKTLLIGLGLCASTTAMAQFEGTDLNDRAEFSFKKAGVPEGQALEDSIKSARSYVSLFQQAIADQNYTEAYPNWKYLMQNTPFINNGIYAGNAPFMFYQLITKETDANKKLAYFNEMMTMFDNRLTRLDSINSFNKVKNTKGDVLAVRADYYNYTAPTLGAACGYSFEKHYGNYSEAINEIKENGGREIEGSVLQNFILISDAYFKQVPSHREQYIQDYLDAQEACEKMLQLAKEASEQGDTVKAQQLVAKYDAPLQIIESTFGQSGAASRDQVIALYEKTIESKKTDLNYLRKAMGIMTQAECTDAPIYFKTAEYAYAIEPTFESAIGLAEQQMKNGNQSKMLEYYTKAIDLCQNDKTKGKICLMIAQSLKKSKSYTGANTYLDKAKAFNEDLTGKALILKASISTSLGQHNDAVSLARQAKAADITVSATADRLIASIEKAKAAAAANAQNNEEYKRQKAAYDAYMAKKKAEEDFWNGK